MRGPEVLCEADLFILPSMREDGVGRYVLSDELLEFQRLAVDEAHVVSSAARRACYERQHWRKGGE
jgi:hypothetical protein